VQWSVPTKKDCAGIRRALPDKPAERVVQARANGALSALLARDRWCLGWRSVLSGVMLLMGLAARLGFLVGTYANVRTLVLLFLLNFLVMCDVSCVRHVGSISKFSTLRPRAHGWRRTNGRLA
jgi:hypothetical protein